MGVITFITFQSAHTVAANGLFHGSSTAAADSSDLERDYVGHTVSGSDGGLLFILS